MMSSQERGTTSEEDFETFKETFEGYKTLFGLNDYTTAFQHVDLLDSAAAIQPDVDARFAAVALCKEFPQQMAGEHHIEDWARHEAIHLLLADFTAVLQDPASTDELKARLEESLVIKLEYILENYH